MPLEIDYNKIKSDIDSLEGNQIKSLLNDSIHDLDIQKPIKDKILSNIEQFPDTGITNEQKDDLAKAIVAINIIKEFSSQIKEESKQTSPAEEILKGAHVMINGGAAMYNMLENFSKNRISSHHKDNKADNDRSFQAGNIFNEFLFGKTKDGNLWFQLEAHSTGKGLIDILAHLIDFIIYKWTGKNVGQYGISEHVDSKPLVGSWTDKMQKESEKIVNTPITR